MCDDNNGLFSLVDEFVKNASGDGEYVTGGYDPNEEEDILPPEGVEEDDND